MRKPARVLRTSFMVAVLSLAAVPVRAEPAWTDVLQEGWDAARAAQQTLQAKAEQAIVVGGVLLYRHRHAVAGAALGCVAGSMVATTTTLSAGLATGGAALTTAAPAAALGCGLGALGGVAIGQRLDNVYEEP
ncbi:MAG TPA: hypothetical protein VHK45_06230 [Geminicoccaceae bacterium]|jgi:hypothetical protein|nr:hypothetical protein [Geminicoccaceae bacterium]